MAILNPAVSGSISGVSNLIYNVSGSNVTYASNGFNLLKSTSTMTGIYFSNFYQIFNSVAGNITEFSLLSSSIPLANAGGTYTGATVGTNLAMIIQYDFAGSYNTTANTGAGPLARMAGSATVGFTRNSAGTWTLTLAETKLDGYVSDATNFPTSKIAMVLNGGVPSFRFINRTSSPANGYVSFSVQGLISISD